MFGLKTYLVADHSWTSAQLTFGLHGAWSTIIMFLAPSVLINEVLLAVSFSVLASY